MSASLWTRLGLLTLLVVAVGCYKADIAVEINDDGSGRFDLTYGVDAATVIELTDALGATVDEQGNQAGLPTPEEYCEQIWAEESTATYPEGVVVEEYDDGGFCGWRIQVAIPPGDDPGAFLGRALSDPIATGDSEVSGGDDLVIHKLDDGSWRFEMPLDLEATDDLTQGLAAEPEEELLRDAEFTVEVTLPGAAAEGENNADRVDGGWFFWDVDVLAPPDRLFALTRPLPTSEATAPAAGDEPGSVPAAPDATAPASGDEAGSVPAIPEARPPDDGGGGGDTWLWVLVPLLAVTVIGLLGWILTHRSGPPSPAAVAGPAPTPPAPPPEPQWDPSRGTWIIHDPVRGTLIHDPASNTWRPI